MYSNFIPVARFFLHVQCAPNRYFTRVPHVKYSFVKVKLVQVKVVKVEVVQVKVEVVKVKVVRRRDAEEKELEGGRKRCSCHFGKGGVQQACYCQEAEDKPLCCSGDIEES